MVKEFGKDISRREWVKDWRMVICWRRYLDYTVIDLEGPIADYCYRNNLKFTFNGSWLICESNRYHYNNLMNLIDNYYEDEIDE